MPESNEQFDVMVTSKYVIRNTGEEKTKWTKVGRAFTRRKGGFSVRLDFPVATNEFVLLPPRPDERKQAAPAQEEPQGFEQEATDFPPAEEGEIPV